MRRTVWLKLLLAGVMLAGFGVSRARAIDCMVDGSACPGPEEWVQTQIEAGLDADLAVFRLISKTDDITIRPRFLRALIARAHTRVATPAGGIRVRNAFVCEAGGKSASCGDSDYQLNLKQYEGQKRDRKLFLPLDLRDLTVVGTVDLRGTMIRGDLRLGGARFEQTLNLDETKILGDIDAHRLYTVGGLTMFNAIVIGDIEADELRSDGTVNLFQSWILGKLHMRGARIADNLDLGGVWINELSKRDIVKEADNDPPRATVGTPRSWLDLSNADVGRQIYMTGIHVPTQGADLSGIATGGSIWIEEGSRISGHLSLERALIHNSLMLGRGIFANINLAAAQIDRELRLESHGRPTIWREEAGDPDEPNPTRMSLKNAHIGSIRDTLWSWPACLTLTGFVYDRPPHDFAKDMSILQNAGAAAYASCWLVLDKDGAPMRKKDEGGQRVLGFFYDSSFWNSDEKPARPFGLCDRDWFVRHAFCGSPRVSHYGQPRSSAWWLNWIERDPNLTENVFAQLASALTNAGDEDAADQIKFAQRVWAREKSDSGSFWTRDRLISIMQEYLVGFGIGVYGAIAGMWALAAALAAAIFLLIRLCGLRSRGYPIGSKGFGWCLVASVLTVIPLIPLPKSMEDFLHTPMTVPYKPDVPPLNGRLVVGFGVLTLWGLLLGGFLAHGVGRLIGQ